jgi:hypothetical protein
MTTVYVDLDVNAGPFWQHGGAPYVVAWLEAHGLDPMLTHRVEVLADGDGQLRVHQFRPEILTEHVLPPGTDTSYDGWVFDRYGAPPFYVPLQYPVPHQLLDCRYSGDAAQPRPASPST